MPYAVTPIQPSDIPRIVEVQWAALSSNPLTQVLYPRGATAELTAFTIASYQRSLTFPSATIIKATNESTGEVVGFAKWILYRQDEEQELHQSGEGSQRGSKGSSRRSSGWQKEKHLMPSVPPDCHGMLLERWGEVINKTRKRITGPRGHACRTGAPCSLECYFSNLAENLWGKGCFLRRIVRTISLYHLTVLDILHVLPLHQRNGAGASLIDWGLALADNDGFQCYVESSPAARSLCMTKGFRHLAEMRIELGKYREGYHDYRHSVMLRGPYGEDEPPQPPSKADPFADIPEVSPVSPIEEPEFHYTAEAKMLHFRSSSSLKSSARLRDTRSSTTPSSLRTSRYRRESHPLPKTPTKTPSLPRTPGESRCDTGRPD